MTTWIETSLFSVKGGKFHRPAGAVHKSQAWHPNRTQCGITVTPVNYFACDADANNYTGGRLAEHLCKHCAATFGGTEGQDRDSYSDDQNRDSYTA